MYLLEPKGWMFGIRRPQLVGGVCLLSDGQWCRREKLSELPRRLRLLALERLCLTGGVLSQCLFGELGEKILGLGEGQ